MLLDFIQPWDIFIIFHNIYFPLSFSGSSSSNLASANRMEQIRSVTWIKSHLEEDAETSLPKQEVFDDYKWVHNSRGQNFFVGSG